jgi:glycosyltransferase involved in cell wall biosynthesis
LNLSKTSLFFLRLMLLISVVICTHNPREPYLRRVLDALRAQTLPLERWELLLVDNASAEPLAPLWDLSWHPQGRHLREEKLGLTSARMCGITAARGENLVFVDDDNVLRQDYLETAVRIGGEYPWLGAWGGSCLAEYEAEPPPELRPWLAGLVVEKLTESTWAKLPTWTAAAPPGAGIVVRQKLARHYRELVGKEPLRLALGRSGKVLASGEDGDMVLSGFKLGLGAGRFPELELTHLIPAQRVNVEYLERLYEGFGISGVVLNALYCPELVAKPNRLQAMQNLIWRAGQFVSGQDRSTRRIRWAMRRGRCLGIRQLAESGFFKRQNSASPHRIT